MIIENAIRHIPLLNLIIFFPLLGAIASLSFSKQFSSAILHYLNLCISFITFILGTLLFLAFNTQIQEHQFTRQYSWIPSMDISFHVGVNGISLWMIELVILSNLVLILLPFFKPEFQEKSYFVPVQLLTFASTGFFLSLDLFCIYIFWNISIFIVFLSSNSGSESKSRDANIKYFVYQFLGSVILLFAFILVSISYQKMNGSITLNLIKLQSISLSGSLQAIIFWTLFIGFAIRTAVFPFHAWLPTIIESTPLPIRIWLLAINLKLGIYGILRICFPLCPDALLVYSQVLVYVSLISLIYGALIALMQPDILKLISYSSISQTGFLMLGLFVLNRSGFNGSIFHCIQQGFAIIPIMIMLDHVVSSYRSSLSIDLGGINRLDPVLGNIFFIASLIYLGLPGTNVFVGLFLIITGTVIAQPVWAIISMAGFVLTASYLAWNFQKIFLSPPSDIIQKIKTPPVLRTKLLILCILTICIGLGLAPQPILNTIDAANIEIENLLRSHMLLQESESKNLKQPIQSPAFTKLQPNKKSPASIRGN